MHKTCRYAVSAVILSVLVNACVTYAYAQLADTMLCADKGCSETISEGKARLAYRPRDDKFLNLEKGDVVLVKSKNAGKKSHLWGGQVMGSNRFGFFPSSFIKEYIEFVKKPKYNVSIKGFMKGVNGHKSPDLYAGLIGENQRITVDKSRKKKTAKEEDPKKKDEATQTENMQSSEEMGPSGLKSDMADEGSAPTVSPNLGNHDAASKQNQPAPQVSSDAPVDESAAQDKIVEAQNNDRSHHTATPLPPTIAAIMEEKLKSSLNTDDTYETKTQPNPDTKETSSLPNVINPGLDEDSHKLREDAYEHPNKDGFQPNSRDSGQLDVNHETKPLPETNDHLDGSERENPTETNDGERNTNDIAVSGTQIVQTDETHDAKEPLLEDQSRETVLSSDAKAGDTQKTHDDTRIHEKENADDKSGSDTHPLQPDEILKTDNAMPQNINGNTLTSATPELENTDQTNNQLHEQQKEDNTTGGNAQTVRLNDTRDDKESVHHNTPGNDAVSSAKEAIHSEVALETKEKLHQVAINNENSQNEREADEQKGATTQDSDKTFPKSSETAHSYDGRNKEYDRDLDEETAREDVLGVTGQHANVPTDDDDNDEPFEDDIDDDFEVEYLSQQPQPNDKEVVNTDNKKTGANIAQAKDVQDFKPHEQPIASQFEKSVSNSSEVSENSLSDSILDKDNDSTDLEKRTVEHTDLSEKPTMSLDKSQQAEDKSDSTEKSTTHDKKAEGFGVPAPALIKEESQEDAVAGELDIQSNEPSEILHSTLSDGTGVPPQNAQPEDVNLDLDLNSSSNHLVSADSNDQSLPIKEQEASQSEVEDDLASSTPKEAKTETSIPGQESHTEKAITDSKFSHTGSALSGSEEDPTSDDASKYDEKSSSDKDSTIKSTDSSQSEVEDDLASSTPEEEKTETSIPGQESHTEEAVTDSKFSQTGSALSGSKEDPISEDVSKNDEKSSTDKDSTIKSTASSQNHITEKDSRDTDPKGDSEEQHGGNNIAESMNEDKEGNEQPNTSSEGLEASTLQQAQTYSDNEKSSARSDVSAPGVTDDSKVIVNQTEGSHSESMPDGGEEVEVKSEAFSVSPKGAHDEDFATDNQKARQDSNVGSTQSTVAFPDIPPPGPPPSQANLEHKLEVPEAVDGDSQHEVLVDDSSSAMQNQSGDAVDDSDDVESKTLPSESDQQSYLKPDDDKKSRDSTVPEAVEASSSADAMDRNPDKHDEEKRKIADQELSDDSKQDDRGTDGAIQSGGSPTNALDAANEEPKSTDDTQDKVSGKDPTDEDGDEHDVSGVVVNFVQYNDLQESNQDVFSSNEDELAIDIVSMTNSDDRNPSNHDGVATSSLAAKTRGKRSASIQQTEGLGVTTVAGTLQADLKDEMQIEGGNTENTKPVGDESLTDTEPNCTGITSLYDDPLIRWFLPKQTRIDGLQNQQQSVGYTSLYDDPLIRWFLPKQTRIDGVQNHQQPVGYTNLYEDPIIRWFLPEETQIDGVQTHQQSVGYTNLYEDPIIKWFLPKQTRIDEVQNHQQSVGYTNLYEDPIIRWFLPKQTLIDGLQTHQQSVGYTNLYEYPIITWFLPKQTRIDGVQNHQQSVGYTNLYEDPIIRWFLPKQTRIDEVQNQQQSVGYTDLLEDPLIRWFLSRQSRAVKFINKHEDMPGIGYTDLYLDEQLKWFLPKYSSIKSMFNMLEEEEDVLGATNLLDDKLLRWILNKAKCNAVSVNTEKMSQSPEFDANLYTDLRQDPLLKWFLHHTSSSKCGSKLPEEKFDGVRGITSLYDDKLLRWIFSRAQCRNFSVSSDKTSQLTDFDVNSITDLKQDPLLKWFLRDRDSFQSHHTVNRQVTSSNLTKQTVSSYLNDPLLKWLFMASKSKAYPTGSEEESVSSHKESRSSYADHPLLKWIILQHSAFSKSKHSTINSDSTGIVSESPLSDVIVEDSNDVENDCNNYFNDPLMKNTFPGNPDCEEKWKRLNDPYMDVVEDFGETEPSTVVVGDSDDEETTPDQSDYFDNPALSWLSLGGDDSKLSNARDQPASVTVQIEDDEKDEVSELSSQNLESRSLARKLRNMLAQFQHCYENSGTFRIGLSNLQRDLKLFIKVDKIAAKEFHFKIKKCRNDVIHIENEILANIREVSSVIYSVGLSEISLKNVAENTIPKYEEELDSIKTSVDKAMTDMNVLQNDLHTNLYENSEVSELDDDTLKESNEIDELKNKLAELDRKLAEKNTRSGELVKKMEKEAGYFQSRILQLEASLEKRMKDEEQQSTQYVEREKKIDEQIQSIKSTLAERSEEKKTTAREGADQFAEKLKELEAGLKVTVEADKPLLERIAFLESELSARKHHDQENAKLERSEAILLRSKIQSLERQLKKQRNIGSAKMLLEARFLKDKVRTIEKNLADKTVASSDAVVNKQGDPELQDRIARLEAEFKERLLALTSENKTKETSDLKMRVLAMEGRLHNQMEAADKLKNVAIQTSFANKTQVAAKIRKKRRSQKRSSRLKKMNKDEILRLLNSIFFRKGGDKENVRFLNQSSLCIEGNDNSDVNFKCSVDQSRRKACGAKHYTKEFCNALQCCWKPVPDDPTVPACYFSLLQLDGMGKNMNEKSGESSNQEYTDEMESLNDPQTDKYKVLHEGKMVDWDETIQETPKGDRTPTWDEEIGHETDHVDPASAATDLDDSDAQRDSTTVVPEGYKSSAEENASPHIPVEDNLDEKDEDVPPSHDNGVDRQDEALQERVVTKPEDLNENVAGKKDISTESHDVASDDTTVPRRDLQFVREESTGETAESTKEIFDIEESNYDESKVQPAEHDTHVDSFWIRLLIAVSNVPWDIVYVCEPLSEFWISLLPLEYQKDVFGVAWPVIFFTVFAGFALIFILVCRSRSAKTRRKNEFAQKTINELRTQLDNLSKEKVDVENELRNKQNEVEIQNDQMMKSAEDKEGIVAEKTQLENSIQLYGTENENLKRHIQELTQAVQEKNLEMQQMINNSEQAQERLHSQEQIIESSNQEITKLQESVCQQENNKQEANSTIDKLKERLKNLEKTKGESKKEGKLLKDQIDKLNGTIEDLQQKLDLELEDGEQRKQEIDVLKDCILQFKGAREIFGDEDEEGETEEVLEKQKEKMKEMVDVANIKKLLRQSEADKLQVTYELEAEKEKRTNKETKVTELEAVIQGDEVVRSKLQRDIQTLESKLSVMQDFYAKREVEIQSKLGLEKSRLESNTSLLEDKEKHQGELLDQLNMYKKMCEEAKQKYDQSERKHKQEVVGFEKRAHDNWLASREAERKFEEANKQISRLQMEMDDMKIRLRESERDMIIRPRPERHGPPGAPPPFGPPRRHMPPGSPLHFRSGPPPDADRRSPPHRRPPSPGGSIPGDRPPSRPDRPPSTHSLPPMDRRPPSGPPMGPGHPYGGTPGRPPFRDGPPPMRPPLRDVHHHGRPPSGPVLRPPSGPMTSSPYMERPPIPLSQSPRSQAFTQSSLHATPSHPPIEGLRTDGYKAPQRGPPPAAAPSNVGRNAYRRSKS